MQRLRTGVALLFIGAIVVVSFRDAGAARSPSAIGSAVSELLASPAAPGSGEPNLAVAPGGKVYMSWLEPSDSGHAMRVASYSGGRWSEPSTVRAGRDFFVNWADFPSIRVIGDGRLAAHWLQRTGKGTYAYGVRISHSIDDGKSWSAPVVPHRDTSQTEHGFVALWRDGQRTGAAWLDGRKFDKASHSPANEMTLRSSTIGVSGELGPESLLDARVCDCCQTAAALTVTGPIVAYRDRSPDEIRDIYVVRRIGGKWRAPMPVHKDNWKIAACPVNGPAIAADGDRVALGWFTAAGDSARVNLAFSTNGGARFKPPVRIDDGAPAGRVDVALLSDGSALVSWIERTGGDTAAVRVRRVRPDGRAGPAVTIATSSAARASGFPRMAISGETAFFAWTVPGRPSSVEVAQLPVARIR
jgi:hypothetical protein